ncbi:MAG TPA: hypothetical protein PL149_02510 [Candidatus Kapabacteria bacterium]|nr:hypothetical protein [Candidatus Kapabacteria bacterium]
MMQLLQQQGKVLVEVIEDKMKKLALLLLMLVIIGCSAKVEKRKIMLGNYIAGRNITTEDVSETKADAALSLATRLTGKYDFVEKPERDTIAQRFYDEGKKPILLDIAKIAGADEVAFMRADRFINMLRVELVLVDVADTSKRQTGEGFAHLNYRQATTDRALFDPSLLTATQRAFADAKGNNKLYSNQIGNLNVKPAPTLILTGIGFSLPIGIRPWNLYDARITSSYSALEAIFEVAKNSRDFVVYDLETRDSLYSLFKLYVVENYNLPTLNEIDALRKFKVGYFIAGSYEQLPEAAEISLTLYKINENDVEIIKTVADILNEDKLEEMDKLVAKLAKKLLNINEN